MIFPSEAGGRPELPPEPAIAVDPAVLAADCADPVVVVDHDDNIIVANPAALSFFDVNDAWWPEMFAWRASRKSGTAGTSHEQSDHLVSFEHSDGTVSLAWRAVRLTAGALLLLGRDATPEHRLRQRLQFAAEQATVERHLRDTLTESRQRYKDLVEISSDFAWETDAQGLFVFVSPTGTLGWTPSQLIGHHPRESLGGDDDLPSPFETRRGVDRLELWVQGADGEAACIEVSAKPLFTLQGKWQGARGVCRNLTEQVTRAAELSRIRNREKALSRITSVLRGSLPHDEAFLSCARETAQSLDAAYCIIYAFEVPPGMLSAVAASGEPARDFALPLDEVLAAGGPVVARTDDHTLLACATRFQGTVNGAVAVWRPSCSEDWSADQSEDGLLLISDIAERIAIAHAQIGHQKRLRNLSERDGLTGLFNRRAFLELLEVALDTSRSGPSALLYMDLDNFKVLNDQCGHQLGDAALSAVAGLLRHNTRPGDIAGRMGGDEFVLWLARATESVAVTVSQRLQADMSTLESLSAPDRPLSLSIGVAIHQDRDEAPTSLIKRADTAMYVAKRTGKKRYSLAPTYSPDSHSP